MTEKHGQPLVSIIVPIYKAGPHALKCLDSIASQTYRSIELLVVNGSDSGKISKIVTDYQQNHGNVKLIDLGANPGLFRTRLEGFRAATGEYVVSVEGDDSISVDYVRTLVTQAVQQKADIVMGETVHDNGKKKFIFNLAADLPFDCLTGDECLEKFFEQHGENHTWHTVHSRLYSRRVISSAVPFLDKAKERINTLSDVLVSTVLWGFAERVDRAPTAYYYSYEEVSTEAKPLKQEPDDVHKVFSKIKEFLEQRKVYAKFESDLSKWMEGCLRAKKAGPQLYKVATNFNDGLEKLKSKIIDKHIEYVSFDIFDTLVSRPFLRPSDLFYLLDNDFKKLDGQFRLQTFHDIRIKAEETARRKKSATEDVRLSQIYRVIQEEYSVDTDVAKKMLQKELDHEIAYCSQRKTAKELYDLALYADKKIIITSDMYLPKATIGAILDNCGFYGNHKLYVSSHHGTMKATQNLYKYITAELSLLPESMLHIGDSYDSDVAAAEGAGWQAVHFPKASELASFDGMLGGNVAYARNHLGVTTAYAVAANKYFDNPFRSFHKDSNYNSSPYFMGYFALGLAMLGFTRWVVEDLKTKQIKSAVFLSRDGYLPMQIFTIFQQQFNLPIQSSYLPTSRKATIPLSIFGEASLSDIKTFNYRGQLTVSILTSLKDILKDGTNGIRGVDFSRVKKLQKAFTNTYKNYFSGSTAVIDIGYSGRPEQVFAKLFNVPIQTYFMYTANDEAKRRLGKTVNIYSGLSASGIIQERIVSELAPSCIGYTMVGDKVEPLVSEELNMSYYERYVISQMQRGATDFIKDYLKFFHNHLSELELGENALAIQPLGQAIQFSTPIDREIFRGLIHEDDIAGDGSINVFNEYYSYLNRLEAEKTQLSTENTRLHEEKDQLYAENTRLQTELSSHLGIKRSAKLLTGNVKRKIKYGKKR